MIFRILRLARCKKATILQLIELCPVQVISVLNFNVTNGDLEYACRAKKRLSKVAGGEECGEEYRLCNFKGASGFASAILKRCCSYT
jgi:hypothetical protein